MNWFQLIREDFSVVFARDPAVRSRWAVLTLHSGFRAVVHYRMQHALWGIGLHWLARWLSLWSRWTTGVEIHPAVRIGRRFFIDHGMGIVIGETAELGDDVSMYQGVTLGGTGKEKGKRHPTLGNNVVVASGAKVLGSFTVGDHAKIGAGSVVLGPVPAHATVVGIPGRIVVMNGHRVRAEAERLEERELPLAYDESAEEIASELDVDLDHNMLPDPEAEMIEAMRQEIEALKTRLSSLEERK